MTTFLVYVVLRLLDNCRRRGHCERRRRSSTEHTGGGSNRTSRGSRCRADNRHIHDRRAGSNTRHENRLDQMEDLERFALV